MNQASKLSVAMELIEKQIAEEPSVFELINEECESENGI